MPELPEVETTCNGIRPYLLGHSILSVDVHEYRLRWPVSEEIESLKNAKVISITRRAKYILISFKHGTMLCHLGMSGSFRIIAAGSELRKHDHLVFQLSSGLELRYHDPRRFGCALFTTSPENHPLLNHLGPEPLTDDFHLGGFYAAAKKSTSPIKTFIMNNKTVVGVGNIYACESLFLSGIAPTRKANNISKARLQILLNNIKTVLAKAIEQGGTTLKDFVNQDGQAGYFQQQLFAYGREGEICRQCDSTIKRIVQTQRSTFYCSKCQK